MSLTAACMAVSMFSSSNCPTELRYSMTMDRTTFDGWTVSEGSSSKTYSITSTVYSDNRFSMGYAFEISGQTTLTNTGNVSRTLSHLITIPSILNPPFGILEIDGACINDNSEITLLVTEQVPADSFVTIDFSGYVVFQDPYIGADITGDYRVDAADLGVFQSLWGSSDARADLNFDGVVDGADQGILLSNWTDLQE